MYDSYLNEIDIAREVLLPVLSAVMHKHSTHYRTDLYHFVMVRVRSSVLWVNRVYRQVFDLLKMSDH